MSGDRTPQWVYIAVLVLMVIALGVAIGGAR